MFAYGINNFVNLVDPTGFGAEQGVGSSTSKGTYLWIFYNPDTCDCVFADLEYLAENGAETSTSVYKDPLIYQAPIQSGFWSAVGSGIDYNLKNIEPSTVSKYALKV